MQVTGQVGTQGPIASGSPGAPLRQGNYGDVIFSELNGRYYENAVRGNIFVAAQTAALVGIVVGAGGATLVLFNPNNSGKNLVLLDVTVAMEANGTPATQQIAFYLCGAATGATQTLTTPLTAQSSLVGTGATAQGKSLVSSTFSNTATPLRYIGAIGISVQGTAVGTPSVNSIKDDIGGSIIIPPGSFVGVYCLGGTPGDISIASSMTWAELSSTVL